MFKDSPIIQEGSLALAISIANQHRISSNGSEKSNGRVLSRLASCMLGLSLRWALDVMARDHFPALL